jgi:hypothetical protein
MVFYNHERAKDQIDAKKRAKNRHINVTIVYQKHDFGASQEPLTV